MKNFAILKMSLAVPFGVAAIGLASPAFAFEPAGSANASSSRVEASGTTAPAAEKASAKKICMSTEAATGTRLTTRECKTKAEWERLGYEFGDER